MLTVIKIRRVFKRGKIKEFQKYDWHNLLTVELKFTIDLKYKC